MNAGMIHRAIRALCLMLILCVVPFSHSMASGIKLSVHPKADFFEWSIDLSHIQAGQSVILVFPGDMLVDAWSERNDLTLAPLFEYAMPRFELSYDTFDCWVRELIMPKDTSVGISGEGRILGLSGQQKPAPNLARGEEDNWIISLLEEFEKAHFEAGIFKGEVVYRLELSAEAHKEKRIVRFRSDKVEVPLVYIKSTDKWLVQPIHLFTFFEEDLLLAEELADFRPMINPVLLPPYVNEQRQLFQDSLMHHWENLNKPTLVYTWNIGSEGGDKCAPCSAPPPQTALLEAIGIEAGSPNLYVSYTILPVMADRELTHEDFEHHQYVFEMNEPSKGYLQCPEAAEYHRQVKERQRIEEANLRALFGLK